MRSSTQNTQINLKQRLEEFTKTSLKGIENVKYAVRRIIWDRWIVFSDLVLFIRGNDRKKVIKLLKEAFGPPPLSPLFFSF